MGSPKAAVSPNTFSVSVTTKLVVIESFTADGLTAITTDKSGYEYRVPVLYQRAKGVLPATGEQWLIGQDALPSWSFLMFMGSAVSDYPAASGPWESLPAGGTPPWEGTVYYRLTADDEVQLYAALTAPSTTPVNNSTIVTLPSEFQPATLPVTFGITSSSGTNATATLGTGGTLRTNAVSGTGSAVTFGPLRIPLLLP